MKINKMKQKHYCIIFVNSKVKVNIYLYKYMRHIFLTPKGKNCL